MVVKETFPEMTRYKFACKIRMLQLIQRFGQDDPLGKEPNSFKLRENQNTNEDVMDENSFPNKPLGWKSLE